MIHNMVNTELSNKNTVYLRINKDNHGAASGVEIEITGRYAKEQFLYDQVLAAFAIYHNAKSPNDTAFRKMLKKVLTYEGTK